MASLSFLHKISLLWRAFVDKRTSWWVKALIIFAILYGVSPVDAVPDIIPLFGQLDDIGVIVTAVIIFWNATKKVRSTLQD